jgi:hypothetical protein
MADAGHVADAGPPDAGVRADPPAPSVDRDLPIARLSEADRERICEWVHSLERPELECPTEPFHRVAFDTCMYPPLETCDVTFADTLACAEAIRQCTDINDPPEACRIFNALCQAEGIDFDPALFVDAGS